MRSYLFVLLTIILTVYGQLIIKARALQHSLDSENFSFLIKMFIDPWVLSGLICAFAASATWMLAVQSANLSVIYPLMAMTFVLVPLFAVYFFGDHLNVSQMFGLTLIIVGVWFTAK